MATTGDEEQKCIELTIPDEQNENNDVDEEEEIDDIEEDSCCICQDVVCVEKQGFLSSCDHRFHFECIVTWSKVTNLCPLCKLKFNEVERKNTDGAVVHREAIPDTKQVFRPDPRDHDIQAQLRLVNNVRCEMCGRGDDEHVLLMCEAPQCMNASHTYCLGLDEVPSHSWYCSRHHGGPSRASDFIARPASTVSSRRRTRRLATLMSNVMSGVGAVRRRGSATASGATRTRRGRARLVLPDSEGLDIGNGRPIRGVALSYAMHMSRELQAIQQRADAMFARGDLGTSALYAPPRSSLLGSRSTSTRSATDQMWEDRALSQRQLAEAYIPRSTDDSYSPATLRANTSRIASTFASEYRDIVKRMTDAASHDNYASTVSLTIPKTARLRLAPSVKAFFGKLNEREKIAALDAGCLSVLLSWIRVAEAGEGGNSVTASKDLHPHVMEAVLMALEALPVRKEDLAEVRGFTNVLDEISTQPDVALDLRERCIVLSETWRDIDPPPVLTTTTNPFPNASSTPALPERQEAPVLPSIQAFTTVSPSRKRSGLKRKASQRPQQTSKKKNEEQKWTTIAVDYVKAKLYPLYKDSKGKMSKEDFKTVVKQVLERFRADAAKMQSAIMDTDSSQLTSVAKQRLMQLLDQVYRASHVTTSSSLGLPRSHAVAHANASYSAVPTTTAKRQRTS